MFGELMLCGYPPEDLVYHTTFIDSMELHLERIVNASKGLTVIVGLIGGILKRVKSIFSIVLRLFMMGIF